MKRIAILIAIFFCNYCYCDDFIDINNGLDKIKLGMTYETASGVISKDKNYHKVISKVDNIGSSISADAIMDNKKGKISFTFYKKGLIMITFKINSKKEVISEYLEQFETKYGKPKTYYKSENENTESYYLWEIDGIAKQLGFLIDENNNFVIIFKKYDKDKNKEYLEKGLNELIKKIPFSKQ